jgi:RNA polymerase sigma-70 factor (ECF subfamily)
MDDVEAIRRLKKGDLAGFEILFSRYQRKAVQTAYLVTHDEQIAEDVVQDTFVRIYKRIGRFDERRPFEPYLLRSVVNAALNASEKTARWVHFGSEVDLAQVTDLLFQTSSTEDAAEYTRLKGEVAAALGNLPPRQRAVIVQRYYLDMGEKEMAQNLSTAPGNVKWLLSDARKRLRDLLGSERSEK